MVLTSEGESFKQLHVRISAECYDALHDHPSGNFSRTTENALRAYLGMPARTGSAKSVSRGPREGRNNTAFLVCGKPSKHLPTPPYRRPHYERRNEPDDEDERDDL